MRMSASAGEAGLVGISLHRAGRPRRRARRLAGRGRGPSSRRTLRACRHGPTRTRAGARPRPSQVRTPRPPSGRYMLNSATPAGSQRPSMVVTEGRRPTHPERRYRARRGPKGSTTRTRAPVAAEPVRRASVISASSPPRSGTVPSRGDPRRSEAWGMRRCRCGVDLLMKMILASARGPARFLGVAGAAAST